MPWRYAQLRGNRVLVKVGSDGAPAGQAGRVEIRYKKEDPRAYRAAIGNLELEEGAWLEDSAVVEGAPVADKAATKSATSKKSAPGTTSGTKGATTFDGSAGLPEKAWIAYTDGACSGNPGPAGSGFVVISPEGRAVEGYEFLGTSTNNVAELTGILRAVEIVPKESGPLVIFTDSSYAIGVLSKGWKAKVNQQLIETIRTALRAHGKTELRYVPGHKGVPLNERADELARGAITERGSHIPIWTA